MSVDSSSPRQDAEHDHDGENRLAENSQILRRLPVPHYDVRLWRQTARCSPSHTKSTRGCSC